ncbi:MAG: hypothetical protein Q7S52_00890 [bacterium]|nr:hypothetical protein [bacterium]
MNTSRQKLKQKHPKPRSHGEFLRALQLATQQTHLRPHFLTKPFARYGASGGWSTLELLIALAVIMVVLVPATQVVLGNTEFARDTRFSQAALVMADHNIENAGRELHADWDSATTEYDSTSEVLPDEKSETMTITDISECLKEVTSQLDWDNSPIRPQATGITTLITNPDEVRKLLGNCNTTPPSGGWDNPTSYGAIDFSPAGGKALDVDVVMRGAQRIAFIAASYSATGHPDLLIVDVSDPVTPVLISDINLGVTLNAIVVAGDYVYGAADNSTDQLVVVNVSDLSAPALETSRTLPGVDSAGSYPQGRSIAFYDDVVYIGTWETAGPEFHSIDVSSPTAPVALDSVELTHSVKNLVVVSERAYLATTADTAELMVIDVSDPNNLPDPISDGTVFDVLETDDASASGRDATAVHVLGDHAYLGREGSGQNDDDEHEYFILDVSDSAAITKLGSLELNLKTGEKVVGLAVSGPYGFIVSDDSNIGFQVWDITDPANIVAPSSCDNLYNYPEKPTALDFMDDFGFVSNESNKALRVIYDDPVCVP